MWKWYKSFVKKLSFLENLNWNSGHLSCCWQRRFTFHFHHQSLINGSVLDVSFLIRNPPFILVNLSCIMYFSAGVADGSASNSEVFFVLEAEAMWSILFPFTSLFSLSEPSLPSPRPWPMLFAS